MKRFLKWLFPFLSAGCVKCALCRRRIDNTCAVTDNLKQFCSRNCADESGEYQQQW